MNTQRVIVKRHKKTIYRAGDIAVKVFHADYPKADILNEALNQARMEESALNVPAVVEITKRDDQWAIISQFIEGKTLGQLMEEDSEHYDQYLEKLVSVQLQVQQQTVPLLNKLGDKLDRKLMECDLPATLRFDLHARLEKLPRDNKVCHGDLDPSNIILTADGKAFIIDWAHVTKGSAAADCAWTYLRFRLGDKKASAKQYLDLFCRKSGTDPQEVRHWLPIVAAARLTEENPHERNYLLALASDENFD